MRPLNFRIPTGLAALAVAFLAACSPDPASVNSAKAVWTAPAITAMVSGEAVRFSAFRIIETIAWIVSVSLDPASVSALSAV